MVIHNKCLLCGCENHPLVKAHIIAKGLLKLNMLTGHSFALIDAEGNFKRRRDGLFLDRVTCRNCEDEIFTPLDTYAIGVFCDEKKHEQIDDDGEVETYCVNECDRQKLRAYFASLMYRFGLCGNKLSEAKNVILGDWLNVLRKDLCDWNKSSFNYIDALCIKVRSLEADAFSVPRGMNIGDGVLGFQIDIPHWRFFVSVGSQCHPYVDLFRNQFADAPQYSLSSAFNAMPYCYFSTDFLLDKFNDLIDLVSKYNQKARTNRKVHIL